MTSGRPSMSSGSWPSILDTAPEHDSTVPSRATSMVTTAACCTTAPIASGAITPARVTIDVVMASMAARCGCGVSSLTIIGMTT